MKDYAGALGDLNKADALDPNNSFILQYVSASSIEDPSFELDGSSSPRLRQKSMESDTLSLCVVCCFGRLRGDVKCWMNDYQGALEDLTRADRIKPNDTFTLRYGVH
jgi:tetratricopeptide (TPR) repeat protein